MRVLLKFVERSSGEKLPRVFNLLIVSQTARSHEDNLEIKNYSSLNTENGFMRTFAFEMKTQRLHSNKYMLPATKCMWFREEGLSLCKRIR